ncbi:Ig-like domain-containing protein [Rheinheimera sp. 1928-s]|uniref:Ig-like domain-containing protein n=1 Tax=Rheinheimera sp. 1928-s TaxID=3033803 RepID=UPI0026152F09|nr:Ig-like domain-containing protein [Rheinheimera sp. 1928-s]MDF3125625.1 Ig-like domain-containing protein [Rheinheimera sp. 1928-s]
MLRVRCYFIVVLLFLLAACGGGGTITDDDDDGGTTEVITISLVLTNAAAVVSSEVSKAQPLTLTATLTSSTGRSMAGQLVTFSLNDALLANFNNEAGTAQTNSNGVAVIGVLVGTKSGAGTIAATLTGGQSTTISFASAGDADDVEPEKPVGSLRLIADTLQLGSGSTAQVALSAVVLDTNNVLQPGVTVQFSSSSGELEVVSAVTESDGVAKANLSSSVDPSLRTVTVTAAVGDKSATVDINVVGTSILISAPRSMVLSDEVTITADLTDFDGKGIQGRTLAVTSSLNNPITSTSLVTAGNSGRVTFTYRATQGGTDELTVAGLGATAVAVISVQSDQFQFLNTEVIEVPLGTEQQLTVEWLVNNLPNTNKSLNLTTTRGTLGLLTGNLTVVSVDQTTNLQGQASVLVTSSFAGFANVAATEIRPGATDLLTTQTQIEFIATVPNTISVSAFPTQLGPGEQSVVRAVIRDGNNNPVKNRTVAFTLDGAPGGQINPATAITDSQGLASTVFTADNTTGAGTGANLNVQATVLNTAPVVSGATPVSVGTRTLFFRFGTGNNIEEPTASLFSKEFSILVTDSSGNPVAGQDLNVSVLPVSYRKGRWEPIPDLVDFEYWDPVVTSFDPDLNDGIDGCVSEDVNNNGILDPGEDFNGDGQLTPGNVASVPRTVRADTNGIATFDLTYPRDIAPWTTVLLTVSGFADGTENVSSREFVTIVSGPYVADENSGPARNPYGVGAFCHNTD